MLKNSDRTSGRLPRIARGQSGGREQEGNAPARWRSTRKSFEESEVLQMVAAERRLQCDLTWIISQNA